MPVASRMVFFLAAVGTALIVKGARPRLIEDANLDVDHADTEIPVETKSSILLEGQSSTVAEFEQCLKTAKGQVAAGGVPDDELFPIVYTSVVSNPTAWERFKMCTKLQVPKKELISKKLVINGVVTFRPYMTQYLVDLESLHGQATSPAAVASFETRFDACVAFKGTSQTVQSRSSPSSPLASRARQQLDCKGLSKPNQMAKDECQRLYEKCLRNAMTDDSKVKAAIEYLTKKLEAEDSPMESAKDIRVKKPVAVKSLIEQLKHSVHDYNYHGNEEVKFNAVLSDALKV